MFPGVDSESPAPRIRVDVSGPAFPIRETCVSVYFPEHRLYPESEGVSPVEPSERRGRASVVHKDVITMWKGLSIAQAHELDFWERTFQACIEDLIGGFLVFDLSRIHDTGKFFRYPWSTRALLDIGLSFSMRRLHTLSQSCQKQPHTPCSLGC